MPPLALKIFQFIGCVPETNAVNEAETSLLEPGEIDTESPKTIKEPSFLVNSSLTELRFCPSL